MNDPHVERLKEEAMREYENEKKAEVFEVKKKKKRWREVKKKMK